MQTWQSLHDAWWRLATQDRPASLSDALTCRVLQMGSLAYQAGVALRNTAYDRGWASHVTLPCAVISVGNLTVGGTGKTTCVELIAKKLTILGKRVAVLSRGYGGSRREYWLRWEAGQLVVNGIASTPQPDGLADEPQLLAKHLEGIPVVVGPRRDHTGSLAHTTFGVDTVILDDGFQHRRVARDCEIVLVHARMPFRGWALLPRGPMREPLASIKRADIVVVTKADEALETLAALEERLRDFNTEATFVSAVHQPTRVVDGMSGTSYELASLQGLRIGLLSSIGDPAGFEATIRRLHATIVWHQIYPDHTRYHHVEWAKIGQQVQANPVDAVVTTEKDWVRLHPFADAALPSGVPVWVLEVQMTLLNGAEAFDARLARVYTR